MGPSRPVGIAALSVFFALGAAIACTAAVSLAFPESPLEILWRLNPRARTELGGLGLWSAALMLVVACACAASAVGLWRGARWGQVVALGVLAVHIVGDTLGALTGVEPRAVVGIPIVGLLIGYLLSARARRFFAAPKRTAVQ